MKFRAKILFAQLVILLVAFGCKNTNFAGVKLAQPAGPPPPTPPPVLWLQAFQLNPDAQWKSCLWVTVNGDEKGWVQLACNNDKEAPNCNKDDRSGCKKVPLPVAPNACNTMRVKIQVYRNLCPDVKTCAKPYADAPEFERSTANPDDKKFFKIYDARTIANPQVLDPLVKSSTNPAELAGVQDLAIKTAASEGRRWFRMYFEDADDGKYAKYLQAKTNPSAATAAVMAGKDGKPPQTAEQLFGMDYNDYSLDLIGLNIPMTVEGSELACGGNF